jgi:hypothetical protein
MAPTLLRSTLAALAALLATAAPASADVFLAEGEPGLAAARTTFDWTRAWIDALPASGTVRDTERYAKTFGEVTYALDQDAFVFDLRHFTEGATVNEYGSVQINSNGDAEVMGLVRFQVDTPTSYELSGQHGTSANGWLVVFDVQILALPSQAEHFGQFVEARYPQNSAKSNRIEGRGSRGVFYPGVVYELRFQVGVFTPLIFRQDVGALGRLELAFIPGVGSGDSDRDGLFDEDDNCPAWPNLDQADADGDALGDACDRFPVDPNNAAAQLAVDIDVCRDGVSGTIQRRVSCLVNVRGLEGSIARLEAEGALGAAGLAALEERNAELAAEAERLRGTIDSDGDGVPDVRDACPGTRLWRVDEEGCSFAQRRRRWSALPVLSR